MSLVQNCDDDVLVVNTGTKGNKAMGPVAALVFADISKEYTAADIAGDFLAKLTTDTAAAGKARIYPVFGQLVPIRDIQNTVAANVKETFPDGSTAFVRNGLYTSVFVTKEGGECLGKIFFAMNGSALGFIAIDGNNQVKMRKLANGNFGFFPTNMIDAPLPTLASYTEVYKNAIELNYDPKYYVKQAAVLTSTQDLTGLQGLIDVYLSKGTLVATTTKLRFYLRDLCCDGTLLADYATEAAHVNNFVVYNVTDSATITPSAAAVVSPTGEEPYVELTMTAQTSADVIRVSLAAAADLLANDLPIEGADSISITIP